MRTVTVTSVNPAEMVAFASERDEPLERHLRRALNALPGVPYTAPECAELAPVLRNRGWAAVGGRTVLLTEHADLDKAAAAPLLVLVQQVAALELDTAHDAGTLRQLIEVARALAPGSNAPA